MAVSLPHGEKAGGGGKLWEIRWLKWTTWALGKPILLALVANSSWDSLCENDRTNCFYGIGIENGGLNSSTLGRSLDPWQNFLSVRAIWWSRTIIGSPSLNVCKKGRVFLRESRTVLNTILSDHKEGWERSSQDTLQRIAVYHLKLLLRTSKHCTDVRLFFLNFPVGFFITSSLMMNKLKP